MSILCGVVTSVCTSLSGKFYRLFRYVFLPYRQYACEFLSKFRQNYARKYVSMTYDDTAHIKFELPPHRLPLLRPTPSLL